MIDINFKIQLTKIYIYLKAAVSEGSQWGGYFLILY